jgi:hypothetical protein
MNRLPLFLQSVVACPMESVFGAAKRFDTSLPRHNYLRPQESSFAALTNNWNYYRESSYIAFPRVEVWR